jgi:hypothetical protein
MQAYRSTLGYWTIMLSAAMEQPDGTAIIDPLPSIPSPQKNSMYGLWQMKG